MACISKLAKAIAYDCDGGATGLVSAIIINKADIASFVLNSKATGVSSIDLVPGAKAYKIDTVKKSLVLSSALRVNDGAPNANTHTASIVYTGSMSPESSADMQSFSNGSFVIIAKPSGLNAVRVYGLYYGLSATAMDNNSHENGSWIAVTLETPENVIGEDYLIMADSTYFALYAAAEG